MPWWTFALIVGAGIAAYHNSWHGPFVFDDASSIVTNPTIRQLWPLSDVLAGPVTNVTAQGRPILNLSLAINHALGGTAVEGYHVFNLLIHTLAGLTLFGLIRRTLAGTAPAPGRSPLIANAGGSPITATHFALAVAVWWTVHPLQTESVTYIIQRAESLVGLFYLLTLYSFVRAVEFERHRPAWGKSAPAAIRDPRSNGWLVLSVVACLFGMATKEVMATAPLMVLVFDRTFFAGTFRAALRLRLLFYLALGSSWCLLAWLVAQTGGNRGGSVGFGVGVGWWEYWLTQFKAIGHYLWLAVWPHPLVFEYGSFWIQSPGQIALPALVVGGLLVATIVALWKRSALGFLGAWFFGILAPTSLAPGTTQMIVEHRMYLPLAAVIAALVGGASGYRTTPVMRAGVFGAIAVALVLVTMARNSDYRTELALWTDTVAKRPANPLAHYMLAGAQERAGVIEPAMGSYERALELKPDFSIAHENYGELLLLQARRADAMRHFQAALRLQPGYADAHANLGIACLAEGRITEAVGHLEQAVRLAPESAMTRYNFANALVAAGRANEAVTEYEAALKLQPAMAEAHFNLANALVELQRPDGAIAHYMAAVKSRPSFAAAHYNLGNALASTGSRQEAIQHYQAALQARPDYAEAHHNLGSALFESGQLADAARHYEAALRLQPDFPNARQNLERVREQMKPR